MRRYFTQRQFAMTRLILLLAVLLATQCATGQDFSFGFKTGLNFNNIKGEKEEGEALDRNIGFHFGATFSWNITDLMGLRGEFLYSQKGTKRSYDGTSYYHFFTANNDVIRTTGVRTQDLNVSNTYLELPVMGFFKPHSRFEVYGGMSFGVLVSSSAFGNLKYETQSANPSTIEHELDFKYLADRPREYTLASPASTVKIGGESIPYPQSAGAYFEFVEDRGNLYKAIDLGVVGGVSVFLSKSLYISGRINYGLTDITKPRADVSLASLGDNGEFIERKDDDRNVSIQASVGFSF